MLPWIVASLVTAGTVFVIGVQLARRRAREEAAERFALEEKKRKTLH